jgi:iron complex outermembrane recepter protein
VLQAMTATIVRESTTVLREVFAIANMDLFEMTGGMAGLAFGAEYRSEDYEDLYDSLSEAGQIVGSSGGSAGGGRNVKAAYFEALFPVLANLEISLAARHDRYSDYGSDTSPKISLRYQPLDTLTLRASYGQGFAAPSLDILTQQPSFGAASVNDPQTCIAFGLAPTCNTQVTTYTIANPNLSSEQSRQWTAGVAWDATDFLNLSVDYYNIKIEERVAFAGIDTVVGCLDGTVASCPPGISVLPGNVSPPQPQLGLGLARDPGTGQILFGQLGFANLGTIDTSGIDLNLRTNFDFGAWGGMRNTLQVGYVRKFSVDGGINTSGFEGSPKYRATLVNQWTYGDFSFGWNINYIHSTLSIAGRRAQLGLEDYGYAGTLPSWTTHDLQANWNTPWNGRVTFGVQNAADKDPVLEPFDPTGRGYRMALYDGYGRVPYFRYTQSF